MIFHVFTGAFHICGACRELFANESGFFFVIFQLSFPSLSLFLISVFVTFSLCIVLWYLHRFPHLLIKSCGKFLWFVIYLRFVCLFYSSPQPHSVRASFRPSLTSLALLCNTTFCDTKVQAVRDLFEARHDASAGHLTQASVSHSLDTDIKENGF